MLLVTESLTLMARNSSVPLAAISHLRRCTPVVVSSVTPMIWLDMRVYQVGSAATLALMAAKRTRSSSLPGFASTPRSFSAFWPRCIKAWRRRRRRGSCSDPAAELEDPVRVVPVVLQRLALVGEDRGAAGGQRGGRVVLGRKMLQDAQRTSAPRACRVSTSTAVWMVMCSEPVMRAPLRAGWRRTRGGWPSARASRARRWRFPCGPSQQG